MVDDPRRGKTTMDSLIQEWDGETVITQHDKPSGAWIFIAIHSSRLGPATGGTRMKCYSSPRDGLADALKLAAGMTFKFAVPGLERGGGKAVIAVPQTLHADARSGLLKRYGKLVHQLGGLFYTGPDVGTSSADMDIIAETGAPYVFARTPAAGGAGSSGPYTALSVFTGIQAGCQHTFATPSLEGRTVLVQGVGSVGGALIEHLLAAGAEVLFSDIDEALMQHFRDERGLAFVSSAEAHATQCDVYSPCALGGVLNEETIPLLKCRVIAGGANNQLAHPTDAERLRARGILYAPDYVVSIGGAMAITGMETLGWSDDEAKARVVQSVRRALERIFRMASEEGLTTEDAAQRIARENLSRG
jgi:glutamate dehydrogenase/leucine dehydrogenase